MRKKIIDTIPFLTERMSDILKSFRQSSSIPLQLGKALPNHFNVCSRGNEPEDWGQSRTALY